MSKSNKILFVPFFIILVVFLIGVVRLFELRFEAGDVYPAYSSLRSDPLGIKAFFESLENLEPITVERNYRPLSRLHPGQDTTFFYLGAHVYKLEFFHEDYLKAFNRLVDKGGRLVISFFPEREKKQSKQEGELSKSSAKKEEGQTGNDDDEGAGEGSTKNKESGSSSEDSPNKQTGGEDSDLSEMESKFVSLAKRWGVGFRHDPKGGDTDYAELTLEANREALPDIIPWHSSIYFDKPHSSWRAIYTHDGHPVIIERRFGPGTIVLSADSYLFSNEALSKERHPRLLAWLVGKNENVIFDESHFGIQKSQGIVGLARKYRLQPLFFGIILLAGLFVWKNSVAFVPALADDSSKGGYDFTSERDYTAGLVSLLRRNVSTRDILSVCVEEWEKSLASDKKLSGDKIKRVKAVIEEERTQAPKQVDPVRKYHTIRRILSERN